ncbi:hypothetical protein J7W19_23255 [Streptomyces mobaraensis NBRC 13819 = DSM 40847]|uniref:Uncharacterized protein n=2 Tax=Streptomyces mobaraensis TaxID=35621 RepID=A0A5N5W3P8_STRMB|nr:hypothetical protein [Streptomyces mobaraensis]EMF00599.1 hypothetical protein H340_10555 [Streptomyces mobaraensis NBRC 13819 = DSM 40847]KAB7836469.1 hypothetical protein FRZ00_25505 [Streptomyces mobaraensis]QTT75914.1 hypothetical protein J7W19_23255 [Streptomyces mobaraensis NBRC 13819 = DSM 40847]
MKTTSPSRKTANPRRTTLAHLKDTKALFEAERPQHAVELPTVTANPRRTVLMTAPAPVLVED